MVQFSHIFSSVINVPMCNTEGEIFQISNVIFLTMFSVIQYSIKTESTVVLKEHIKFKSKPFVFFTSVVLGR